MNVSSAHPTLSKTALCLLALALALALATMPACSINTGTSKQITNKQPRATLLFTSPYLENRFLSLDSLRLYLVDIAPGCVVRNLGKIPLSGEVDLAAERTLVRADRPLYLKMTQSNKEFLGTRSVKTRLFGFIPEAGQDYVVEHIDNPARLRFRVYRGTDTKSIYEINTLIPADCV